jgi:hypothetical protein
VTGGGAVAGWQVLKQLLISVSAPTLVVIGTNGLTVGAPGVQEVIRVRFAAATPQPFLVDLHEGLLLYFNGQSGVWRYYTSAAVTLDLTAILA